jgi:hypothetical protein
LYYWYTGVHACLPTLLLSPQTQQSFTPPSEKDSFCGSSTPGSHCIISRCRDTDVDLLIVSKLEEKLQRVDDSAVVDEFLSTVRQLQADGTRPTLQQGTLGREHMLALAMHTCPYTHAATKSDTSYLCSSYSSVFHLVTLLQCVTPCGQPKLTRAQRKGTALRPQWMTASCIPRCPRPLRTHNLGTAAQVAQALVAGRLAPPWPSLRRKQWTSGGQGRSLHV